MKKNSLIVFLVSISCLCYSQAVSITPEDTIVCGGTTVTYETDEYTWAANFLSYHWIVEGGVFADGSTNFRSTDIWDTEASVTWSTTPQSGLASLMVTLELKTTDAAKRIRPELYGVQQPWGIIPEDVSGNIIVYTNESSVDLEADATKTWWVDKYYWTYTPDGGTASSKFTIPKTTSQSFSEFDEAGVMSVKTYNTYCGIYSTANTANIVRKFPTPSWDTDGYDELMCTNTTSYFEVNAVPNTQFYSWEVTGGYTVWNGLYYGTSATTTGTSILVKSRSSNGSGSISVTATNSSAGIWKVSP